MPFSTNNIQPDFQTPLSYLYVGPTAENTGFTPIVPVVGSANPADDTITHYVSLAGSDANDGLSEGSPLRFPSTAISRLRDGYPDHVRFRCGDTFNADDDTTGDIFPDKTGRSSLARGVIYWYGDESLDRPVLYKYSISNSRGFDVKVLRHYMISGIRFKATGADPDKEDFALRVSVSIGDDAAQYPDGFEYRAVLHGFNEVGFVATHILNRATDTPASIADSLISQLQAADGLTLSREDPNSSTSYINVVRTTEGTQRFFFSEAYKHGVLDVVQLKVGAFSLYGQIHDVLIEDVVFDGIMFQSRFAAGFRPSAVTISRSMHLDNWIPFSNSPLHPPSGMFATGTDQLTLSECFNDYGGYHKDYPTAVRNQYAHSYYLQNDVGNDLVFDKNITVRASSHNLQFRAGGTVTDSFAGRCAATFQPGYDKTPLTSEDKAYVYNNVSSEGMSMYVGDFYGLPTSGQTTALWAYETYNATDADVRYIGNLVCNWGTAPLDQWPQFTSNLSRKAYGAASGSNAGFIYSNNISYKHRTATENELVYPLGDEALLGNYYIELLNSGVMDELRLSGYMDGDETGDDNFDSFCNVVRNRKLQKWDARISAPSINTFHNSKF